MEKMVDLYFGTDSDLLVNVKNEEMHSVLDSTTPHWKQRALHSMALSSCSDLSAASALHRGRFPERECFDDLMIDIVECIFLFDFDAVQIAAILLFVEDAAKMNGSFVGMLSNRTMSRFKRMEMMQIAAKYFVFQSLRRLQLIEDGADILYEALPSTTNITDVFGLSMNEDGDQRTTIRDIVHCDALKAVDDEIATKYIKRATAYFQKWSKWNDR